MVAWLYAFNLHAQEARIRSPFRCSGTGRWRWLDRRPLDGSQGALVGAIPYDCGFLIQLLAEAAALRNDQGK
jgi:hypothetical protein